MADAESSALAVFAAELRAQRARLGWTQVVLGDKDYAAAVIRADKPQDSEESIARAVTARLDRQDLLTRDTPPMLWYLLDEAVLHRQVGGPAVMDAQLAKLTGLAGRPGVVIQLLLFTARGRPPDDRHQHGPRTGPAPGESAELMQQIRNEIRQ